MKKVNFSSFMKDKLYDDETLALSSMKFFQNKDGLSGAFDTYGDDNLYSAIKSLTSPMETVLKNAIRKNNGLQLSDLPTSPTAKNAIEFITESIQSRKDNMLKGAVPTPSVFYTHHKGPDHNHLQDRVAISYCILDIAPPAIVAAAKYLLDNKLLFIVNEHGERESNPRVAEAAVTATMIASTLAENHFTNSYKQVLKSGVYENNEPVEENSLAAQLSEKLHNVINKNSNTEIILKSSPELEYLYNVVANAATFNKESGSFSYQHFTKDLEQNISVERISKLFNSAVENGIENNKTRALVSGSGMSM